MAETRGRSGGTNRDTGSRGPRLSRWNDPKNPREPERPFQTKYPKKEFDDAFRRGATFEELLAISDAWLAKRAQSGRTREISKMATELSVPPRLGGRSKSAPVSGRLKEYKENTWGPGSDLERRYGPLEEADSPFGKMPKWSPSREALYRPELGEDRTHERTLEQRLLDPARRGIPGGPANKQALIDAKQREANRLIQSRTPGPGGDKIVGEPDGPFSPPVPLPRMLREDSTPIRQASFRTDTESADTPPYYPNLPPEEQISQMLWDRMLPSEKQEPWLGKSNVEEWARRVVQREKRARAELEKLSQLGTDTTPRSSRAEEESKPDSDLFWERDPSTAPPGPDSGNPLMDVMEFVWGGGAVQKAKELGKIFSSSPDNPEAPPINMWQRPAAPPGLRQPDAMERMFGGPTDPRPEFLPDPNLGALLELVKRLRPETRKPQEVPQGFVNPQQDGTMFKLKKWIQENLVD